MQGAIVGVGARPREGEGPRLVAGEARRPEGVVGRGHGVGIVVVIDPRHGGPHRHRQLGNVEAVRLDLDARARTLRGRAHARDQQQRRHRHDRRQDCFGCAHVRFLLAPANARAPPPFLDEKDRRVGTVGRSARCVGEWRRWATMRRWHSGVTGAYDLDMAWGERADPGRLGREALPYADPLYPLARYRARSPTDAVYLVQETYARALGAAHQFTPGTNLKAWLFRILRNTFLSQYRHERHNPTVGGTGTGGPTRRGAAMP